MDGLSQRHAETTLRCETQASARKHPAPPSRAAPEAARLDEIGFAFAGVGNPASGSDHRFDALQRRVGLHPLLLGPGRAIPQPMIVYIWPIG
jgi:hypothetical protein